MNLLKKAFESCNGYYTNPSRTEVSISFATDFSGSKLESVTKSFKEGLKSLGVEISNIQVHKETLHLRKTETKPVAKLATVNRTQKDLKALQNVPFETNTFLTFPVTPRQEGVVKDYVAEAADHQRILGLANTAFETDPVEPAHPLDRYVVPSLVLVR